MAQIPYAAGAVHRRPNQHRQAAGDSVPHRHARGSPPPHQYGRPGRDDRRPDHPFLSVAALPTHWVEASGTQDGDLRTVT